ncbi:Unknown protein [Striga hermonthica]|uniref:CCHC-type domain-containing protein n=1 Tax=Striga hermonthica TaxID=68872 RepID=A0A9N7NG41_STRHE|nr:Unknown protein [Striga hermonthica]
MSFATSATRQSSSRPPRSSSSARQCLLCGRSGHEAPNCFRVKPCPHCHRTGHDPRRCFEVVGYPAGWTGKSSSPAGQGRSSGASPSSAGTDRGLLPSNSAKSHATALVRANSVGPSLDGPSNIGSNIGPSLQFGTYNANHVPAGTGLSPEQWQALLLLSRMVEWNASIVIFSMWRVLCVFRLICP